MSWPLVGPFTRVRPRQGWNLEVGVPRLTVRGWFPMTANDYQNAIHTHHIPPSTAIKKNGDENTGSPHETEARTNAPGKKASPVRVDVRFNTRSSPLSFEGGGFTYLSYFTQLPLHSLFIPLGQLHKTPRRLCCLGTFLLCRLAHCKASCRYCIASFSASLLCNRILKRSNS